MYFLYLALSEILSAIMSKAPCIASSGVETTLSLFFLSSSDNVSILTYATASSFKGVFSFCSIIILDKGSNPFDLATVALVFFFCLKGLYKSSTSASVSADAIAIVNSSVNFPC